MQENRPPNRPMKPPPIPSWIVKTEEKKEKRSVSHGIRRVVILVIEHCGKILIFVLACIASSGLKSRNPDSNYVNQPKIYHSAPASKPVSNTRFACILGIGTEGIVSSEKGRLKPTPENLVNQPIFPHTATGTGASSSVSETIKQTIDEFKKQKFPFTPKQTIFKRRLPDGKSTVVNFLDFGMNENLTTVYQEFCLKREKLCVRSNELHLLAFQNNNFCVVTSNLSYIPNEVRAISQKVGNFLKELEVADKKDLETVSKLENSSKILRQQMDKTFENILEAHVSIGIAKAKGCSTHKAYYIPVTTETDSRGDSLRKLDFGNAKIGNPLNETDSQNYAVLAPDFLNRACSDFYSNKFLPGSSFIYDPFFVHLSGLDENCKTFGDWSKLVSENGKQLMANLFKNDNELFDQFVEEATNDFNSKIDQAILFGTAESTSHSNPQNALPNTNTAVTLTLGPTRTQGDSTPPSSPSKKRSLEITPIRRQVAYTLLSINNPEEPPRLWGAVRQRVNRGQQRALPAPERGPGHQGRQGGNAGGQN